MSKSGGPRLLLAFTLACALAACGGAPEASPSAIATARPTPTPDPHLTEPATADEVIAKLVKAKIALTANNATIGPDGEPHKEVNATYAGWPLAISEYSSNQVLLARTGFVAGKPKVGEPVYVFVGLNIMVGYGPAIHGLDDEKPSAQDRDEAIALARALDALLGPLQQATIDPMSFLGPSPTPVPSPSDEASPDASPAP